MKNTIAYKLAVVATSLVMAYFASGIASIAQANELLKAEPVKQASLVSQAQENLAISFSTITIAPISTQESVKNMIASNKVNASSDKEITVSKTTLISE